MEYKIINKIKVGHLDLLKKLKGKILHKIWLDEAGDFSLSTTLEAANFHLTIKNIPSFQSDNEEYPQIILDTEVLNIEKDFKEIKINQKIKDIVVIENNVNWEYSNNHWSVVSDIGIKLILENEEFLFLMQDSIAGFIKNINSKDNIIITNNDIEEYWSFKTDKVKKLKIEEISL
ncbi:hypothetical protein [Bacillus weihaiensis]|uniref:Uncharacterized protein n=1 Tax=Bacillus weihaiensis TaxID=1547283 RepID=A0A1L3MVD1_9BACI|nr:hypothetical protein [Bacillus weihaiensis]APH06220.1 hypothetical protein A9C19_16535 [Bacillus weihaiensis]